MLQDRDPVYPEPLRLMVGPLRLCERDMEMVSEAEPEGLLAERVGVGTV